MIIKPHLISQIPQIVLLGWFLFGCIGPNATLVPDQITDKSAFTGIPCAAPCWQGLEVGISNERDVTESLQMLTFINQDTIQSFRGGTMPSIDPTDYAQGVIINADCVYPNRQCLMLKIVDGILVEIVVTLNYDIKVSEAIQYLGDPDYVGYGMLGAEKIICEVYLVWNEKKLILASKKFEGFKATENSCGVVRDRGKVASNLLILEARYLPTSAIEFMLSRSYNATFEFTGTIPEK
jgi:hypothetical protein